MSFLFSVFTILFLQGEQCNIVPDNIDDIVADLAPEEKEEGTLKLVCALLIIYILFHSPLSFVDKVQN